jgi:predicted ATPase
MSLICAAWVCCLSKHESLAMVTNLSGKEDVDKYFEELILEKTEGVPFFITPSLSWAGQ